MFLRKHKRVSRRSIDVDEIFMDVRNSPGYHRESFEGVLENPISKNVFVILGALFFLAGIIFFSWIGFLEIARGAQFQSRAENNYLREIIIEPERGVIFDRAGNALTRNEYLADFWVREYPVEGFLHVLGYVTRKDNQFVAAGATGLEALYDNVLRGSPGTFIEEVNAKNEIIDSGVGVRARHGQGIVTTLSRDLQEILTRAIATTARDRGFTGGAAVVMDVKSGGVLALVSVPEFDPNILISGAEEEVVKKLINDPRKPFFNRAVSGTYPPGSIVKPAVAAAALAEGLIDPKKQILSAKPIVIENRFSPNRPDLFPDWKYHGWVDMKRALAVSSDIYFYAIGGGYEDQRGLGVENIKNYFKKFGFGEKTGIDIAGETIGMLPDPNALMSDGRKWGIGDTYHFSIGQGALTVTPIQMAVYATALAAGDVRVPFLVHSMVDADQRLIKTFSHEPRARNILDESTLAEVREGMREAVRSGTAVGLSGIGIPSAAKTGTAEIGDTGRVHSWSIGFAPYDDPQFAWAVLMDNGPVANTVGATYIVSQMLQWMYQNNFLESL